MSSLVRADLRFAALTALGLAIFPIAFHVVGGYPGLATQILIVSIGTAGLNFLLGYTGLLSYGQAMFYGLGSYVALLTITTFFPAAGNFWLPMLLAIGFVALVALAVGALTVRLYGIYFALLTLAFAQMFFFIVFEWRDLTQGDDGIQGVTVPPFSFGTWTLDLAKSLPPLPLGPFGDLSDVHYWYVFVAFVTLAVLVFVRILVRSQFGEILHAIRENEERSTFVGFDPRLYKLAAFVIAGVLTGLSGALRGMYEGSTATDSLSIGQSGDFVIYAIIGGLRTLFGPVLGTGLVMYLQNVVSARTDAWRLVEGLLFVLVVVFLPTGLLGAFRKGGRFVALGDALAKNSRNRTRSDAA